MQKRPFLLLELLIAFSLIAIFLVPLVKAPLSLYREEIKELEMAEKERLADWTLSEVKELLFKNLISWESIPQEREKKSPVFPLPNGEIEIPGCKPKKVQRSFQIITKGIGSNPNETEYRQVLLVIWLDQEKYEFRQPIQKHPASASLQ